MSTLPSFVELMVSLGLDQASTQITDQAPSICSSPSSSPRPSAVPVPLQARSNSSQSLRDTSTVRQRVSVARFSPYSPVIPTTRRGSLSSLSSSSSELDRSPRDFTPSSRSASSPHLSRRSMNKLSVNVYGSASDLAVNTPISTYLRRKTPGTSPTSPTFPREPRYDSQLEPPTVPFTVPILPTLLPNSVNSDSPSDMLRDAEPLLYEKRSPIYSSRSFADISQTGTHSHRSRRHTGIRISTSRSVDLREHYPRRRSFAHIA